MTFAASPIPAAMNTTPAIAAASTTTLRPIFSSSLMGWNNSAPTPTCYSSISIKGQGSERIPHMR